MKYIISVFAYLLISYAARSQAQLVKPFVHPGMMQSGAQLEMMKAAILAGKQPWKDAFDRLKSKTPINYQTSPVTHLSQGAYGAGDQGGKELLKSAEIAYNAALLWYVTKDQAYAKEAAGILHAWSSSLWDFDGNNAKLLAGLSGHYLLNAAEILRYSASGWQERDIRQFKQLMLTVYYPLIKDFFPEANGNWDASMINTMLCIGVFCDDATIFNRAVERFKWGNGNGGITKYIYPGGQIQETTRDWGHVQLGLGEFAKAAQTAWTQGVDFYSAADNRLARGFEYASKHLSGDIIPAYGTVSPRDAQNLRDIYENVYNHYHYGKHLDMPYTLRMVKRTRPESSAVLLISLTEPLVEPTSVIKLPEPGSDALRVGAAKVTAEGADHPVRVVPGDSVQQALDQCPKGGHVLLTKGIHRLHTPLLIPSDVSITGEGKETILFLNPNVKDAVMVNKSPGMHNVTIKDLVIEGAVSTTESTDPNDNRRTRSYQHAAPRAGLVFYGQKDSLILNVRLERLTIQNCTRDGIMITGAEHITITDCDISDNGASVAPGPGSHHNVQLTHVKDVQVKNCRLDTSPYGAGLFITQADQVAVTGNEAARNKAEGIFLGDVTHFSVSQNLTEGNDQSGIAVSRLFNGSSGAVSGNMSQYNGQKGITLLPGIEVNHNLSGNNRIKE